MSVPCNRCCYCRTGENEYCEHPRDVDKNKTMPCNTCCYCRTGEKQYCEHPIKIIKLK